MQGQRFLISGANGFVGRALCKEAVSRGFSVRGATRAYTNLQDGVECVAIGDIDDSTDWHNALSNCDVVIHLAARVHVMYESSKDPLSAFRKVNVAGTKQLAQSAAARGIKRMVYVSSIKVNGECTNGGHQFSEQDKPSPHDAYGVSKWEAERALQQVALETGLEVVIVRLPLVYGEGVKGNFAQLLRAVACGIPLPLAQVNNQRDFLYLGNLVDALITCAMHPAAANQTYFVSDGEAVSTPDLLSRVAEALGVSARLFYVPLWILKMAGRLTGRTNQLGRLVSSLQVDSGKIRRELGWVPPFTLQEGLNEMVTRVNP